MAPTLREALHRVRGVTAARDALAAARRRSQSRFLSNTHVHIPPNFSAFADAADAVKRAAAEGLACFGAGNYYDFAVYGDFALRCMDAGILPLFGVEVISLDQDLQQRGIRVNDPDNPGRTYICGKGISRIAPPGPRAAETLARIRGGDCERMREMIKRLNAVFARADLGCGLEEAQVTEDIARRCGAPSDTVTIQERHLARACQEAVFRTVSEGEREGVLARLLGAGLSEPSGAVKVQQEIRSRLMKAGKPCYIEEQFVSFAEARALVLDLGGIPCYPVLADGASPVCEFEVDVDRLADEVKSRGIHCVEFIPVRNDAAVLERYVKAIRGAGLVVTAGTEHNTPQMFALAPAARGGGALPEGVEEIFMEGAAVVAAHEYLSLNEDTGFVDGEGRLNTEHGNRERLIGSMAAIGRHVIDAVSGSGGR